MNPRLNLTVSKPLNLKDKVKNFTSNSVVLIPTPLSLIYSSEKVSRPNFGVQGQDPP